MRSLTEGLTHLWRTATARRQRPRARPLGLRELDRLKRLPGGPLLILQGDRLVRHGHPFYDLYAVCSGVIEASVTNAAGHRKVLGRYRSGEIIGLDAIGRGTYPGDFLALESSTLCAIPLTVADQYVSRAPLGRVRRP